MLSVECNFNSAYASDQRDLQFDSDKKRNLVKLPEPCSKQYKIISTNNTLKHIHSCYNECSFPIIYVLIKGELVMASMVPLFFRLWDVP